MSAAAASGRAAFLLSRFRDLSLRCHPPYSLSPGSSTALPRRGAPERRLPPRSAVCCCFASGVDGGSGGLADEFVFTAREERRRRREYSALANVLCRVEPLDSSVIGAGVSAAAKDAMKRTISSMLGLLPSDQFHVAVGVSRQPLRRLLVSSVITGYTLWNAEYRLSLMKNFDSSPVSQDACLDSENDVPCDVKERVDGDESEHEMAIPESFEVSSPAALSYIRKLEADLANTQKELDAQRQENRYMGSSKGDDSDLLEYLRSLEPAMVTELSQPSSLEVEEIIQQLAQNVHLKCFGNDATELLKDTDGGTTNFHNFFAEDNTQQSDILNTTRDYLARLLFCAFTSLKIRNWYGDPCQEYVDEIDSCKSCSKNSEIDTVGILRMHMIDHTHTVADVGISSSGVTLYSVGTLYQSSGATPFRKNSNQTILMKIFYTHL